MVSGQRDIEGKSKEATKQRGKEAKAGKLFASIAKKNPFAILVRFALSKPMELLKREEIVRLSLPERLALLAQLWDSREQHQLPLNKAQEIKVERRHASLDQDRRGLTWAALKAEPKRR